MTRTQIQFPDPLYERLKKIAEQRDWSLAEVVRRASEAYLLTLPEELEGETGGWEMPTLRRSGGYLADPATIKVEAESVTLSGDNS